MREPFRLVAIEVLPGHVPRYQGEPVNDATIQYPTTPADRLALFDSLPPGQQALVRVVASHLGRDAETFPDMAPHLSHDFILAMAMRAVAVMG